MTFLAAAITTSVQAATLAGTQQRNNQQSSPGVNNTQGVVDTSSADKMKELAELKRTNPAAYERYMRLNNPFQLPSNNEFRNLQPGGTIPLGPVPVRPAGGGPV
jgi:negative regulator of sigma E activity